MKIFFKLIKVTVVFFWFLNKVKSVYLVLVLIVIFLGSAIIHRKFKLIDNVQEDNWNVEETDAQETSATEAIASHLYYTEEGWSADYIPVNIDDISYIAIDLFGLVDAYVVCMKIL